MRLLLVLLASLCPVFAPAQATAPKPRPNLVVIMADDLGFECLGCNGSEVYKTPHLDALAASGMRFVHAHAQPICTPSRVQIMTGIYNNKNYLRFGILDPQAVTFANVLRDAGFATCIAGKWQLKGGYDGVRRFGFDRHCLWQLNRVPSRYPNPGLEIDGQRRDFKNGEFGPDVVSDYICAFMTEQAASQRRAREQKRPPTPFLVYYPMIAPHWPFVPTPGSEDWDPKMWRDAKREPGGYRGQKYWSLMVEHTDKMVGKVLAKIDALGLRENTMVLFTGDNGTYTGITSKFRGRDYRGGKGSTKDAGTHVPLLIRWPRAAGTSAKPLDDLVDLTDVFPTLLDVAGVPRPKNLLLDGVSLAPLAAGRPRQKDHIYCWYQRNGQRQKAAQLVRDRRFKLYADGRFFDVAADPLEVSPLLPEAAPQHHARLTAALQPHLQDTEKVLEHIQARKRATKGLK